MKRIFILFLALIICFLMASCNKQIIDLNYAYDYAIVLLPNGEVVEGKVETWRDYDDGDQIQVKIDGKVYLVHSVNIALIKSN